MPSLFVLLGVFVILYGIMIEVFTVLFQMTGVTREKARSQVISLLTNSGFTTSESEIIMSAKRRRQIASVAMLCGYSFAVIIVSVLINLFLTMSYREIRHWVVAMAVVCLVILLYTVVRRQVKVRQWFDQQVEAWGNRVMFGRQSNALILIDIVQNKALVEATLTHVPVFMEGKKLSECNLRAAHNVQILYIKRDGEPLTVIDGDTMIQRYDSILLYGDYREIRAIFERPEAEAS